jgi:hypothetical protein
MLRMSCCLVVIVFFLAGVAAAQDAGVAIGATSHSSDNSSVKKLSRDSAVPFDGLTWTFIGPHSAPQGPNGIVSGIVTAIAVDTTDTTGNTVFAGSADGGVWKTTNGGATWTPLADNQATLAIGAIAIAPSNHDVIYAGTGVPQWIGTDVYAGAGVLRSTDGGATWAQTCTSAGTAANATCPFIGPFSNGSLPGNGARISALAVNPANSSQLLAATQIFTGTDSQPGEPGIYCSDDQGATWILLNLHPAEGGGAAGTAVFYASESTAYAALGRTTGDPQNGIYFSANAGAACASQTWAPVTGAGLPAQSGVGHIAMAFAPNVASNPGNADATKIILYAEIASASTASQNSLGIFRSVDGGATWVKTSFPDNCAPACAYAMALAVDPDDSTGNTLFAGGNGNPALLRSVDGGNSFTAVDASAASTIPAGYHAIVFAPGELNSQMYAGTDGGIWSTVNAAAQNVSWGDLNAALALTAFNAGFAIDASAPSNSIGGTLRDGTVANAAGISAWSELSGCTDGGAAIVDSFVPSTIYFSCANTAAPAIWRTFAGLGGTPAFSQIGSGIATSDPIDPVPPLVEDALIAGRIYFGTNRVWQSTDAGDSWTAISGNLASTAGDGVALTSIAVDAGNSSIVYTGAEDGTVEVAMNVSTGGLATFSNVSNGLPAREITHIAVDPSDASGNTAYVAFAGYAVDVSILGIATDLRGHIFVTTNGGTSWNDVSCHTADCAQPGADDLPNFPVRDLVIDPDDPAHATIYAATDSGVYVTTSGGASWNLLADGMPNAAVMSLAFHEQSRTLRAATHGRGAWELALPALAGTLSFELSALSQSSITAGGDVPARLTLTGRGFTAASIALWNGSANGVSIVGTPSATWIDVNVAANLISQPGTSSIQVSDASQTPATTNALNFTVIGIAPGITSITPNSASAEGAAGTSDLAIVIAGTGFAANAQATVEGSAAGITTNSVNSAGTQINATLSHLFLQYGGVFLVGVTNPASGGGASIAPLPFTVRNSTPPANDNFGNAIAVGSATFSSTVDNYAATNETTDPLPTCSKMSQVPSKTVWWVYTPSSVGTVTASTAGSSYDTLLAVFTGTPGTFLQIACNDDITPGINRASQISFPATAATTYYFLVGVANPNAIAASPDLESGGKTVFNFTGPAPAGVSALPTTATISAGATMSYNIVALTPPFAGQVALTVSGCPTNATCTFLANTVTAGSGTILSVVTAVASAVVPYTRRPVFRAPRMLLWIYIFIAAFLLLLPWARRDVKSRKVISRLSIATLCATFSISCAGCGALGASDPTPPPTTDTGTPAGSYTITVTATANTITATTSVTLTVD